jgi:hypothetical protein
VGLDEPVRKLVVSLVAARLNVVGTDGPPRVEVTKIGNKPVLVELSDGVLRVRHEDPPRWIGLTWWLAVGRRYHTEVSVAVPHEVATELKVTAGSVVASGLRGDAALHVVSGHLTMLGMTGTIRATTVSGAIEALGVGGDLTMRTTSGEITLADSPAGRVHAVAISGSLTCDLDNPDGSDIRLETTSGEITARVREDSDLDVYLHATSGRVTTTFPDVRPQTVGATRSARGTLGAGTGRLYATALSGNIALLSRPVETEPADPKERP